MVAKLEARHPGMAGFVRRAVGWCGWLVQCPGDQVVRQRRELVGHRAARDLDVEHLCRRLAQDDPLREVAERALGRRRIFVVRVVPRSAAKVTKQMREFLRLGGFGLAPPRSGRVGQ